MNMIVCTCDSCGKKTENWSVLNLNFNNLYGKKEICPECVENVRTATQAFLDQFKAAQPDEA